MKVSLHFVRHFFLLMLAGTFVIQQSFAGITRRWVCTNASNRYWSTAANWSPAAVPAASDKLVFDSGYQQLIYVDVTVPVLSRITINRNANVALEAYGTARQIGLSSSDTALVVMGGTGTSLTLDYYNGSMGLYFTGTGNKAIILGSLLVSSLGTYNATNSSTIVTGSLFGGGDGGSGGNSPHGCYIISTAANLSFMPGGTFYNGTGNTPIPVASWDIASTCIMESLTNIGLGQSFGNFTINDVEQEYVALKGRLTNIRGNFTLSSVYPSLGISLGTDSAFTMNIGGNFIIPFDVVSPGASPRQFIRLSDGNAYPIINIGGSLVKPGGNNWQIDFGSGSGAATINIKHDFTYPGDFLVRTGANTYGFVNFVGASQTLACDSSDRVNFTVKAGSHVTLGGTTGALVMNKTGGEIPVTFGVDSGGILTCGHNIIKGISPGLNYNTNFYVSDNGTIESADANGFTFSGLGSIQTNWRYYSSAANYTFNGSQAQVTGLDAMAVHNLSINNFYPVTLSNRLSVAGTVSMFYYCSLNTSTAAMLILNNGAVFNNNGGTFASGAGYVNGPMQKVGSQAFIFPVGSSVTAATPIGISATRAPSDTFQAQYFHSSAAALGTVTAAGLNHVSSCDYWSLLQVNSVKTAVNVTGYWNNLSAACNNINSVGLMALAHLTISRGGNTWNSYGRNETAGSATNGSVTWNALTTLGYLSLGVTNTIIIGGRMIDQTAVAVPAAWPVPSTGLVHINTGNIVTNAVVSAKITNAAGQLVQTISLLNKTTATATLHNNGIYFITLVNKDGSVQETKRIVIAH